MPDILTHKKFQAGFGMALIIFLAQFCTALSHSWDIASALNAVDWLSVSAPVVTAIGAQGLADFGKEKAVVDAAYKSMMESDGPQSK